MAEPALRAIVGLGNPGAEYEYTRHNAGFWFVDRLADAGRAQFRVESKFQGAMAKVRLGGADLLLLKPATYMNRSGQAAQVRYWSVCSDESHSTRVVDCVADQDAKIDADGDYNVVIATATPPAGYAASFNYMAWGPDAFGRPIVRQLLADPSFKQSIDANQDALLPAVAMGAYFPDTAYCTADVFSANLAAGPAAVFDACKKAQGVGVVPDTGG